MLYINSKLVGYTVLRKKKCEIEGLKKRINYFLLDTLLIDKEYRNKRFANLLMNFKRKKFVMILFKPPQTLLIWINQ